MWLSNLLSRSTTRQPPQEAIQEEIKTENEAKLRAEDDSASDTESQSTPKASASVVALQVPELSLDENDKPAPSNTTSIASPIANNSSSLMPPPPPRTPASKPPSLKPISSTTQQLLGPPRLKTPAPLRTPPSAAASLRNPVGGLSTSTLAPAQRPSRKVVLGPGYSPLDWASLAKDPRNNLRGSGLPPTLIKVTPSMLKAHNGRKGADAWTSYNGKVYNITPYVPFHPGGKGELLRGAGKDSEKLFMETHPWVNWDGILGECLVGILVSENEIVETNALDAMD
ncbi:hypothetical protein UA08_00118 [Talaromyces atroroseus]|uniref:Cytochrome b5 heme-binding domain-containing protein n=1 Tax=Talaromyces atroroseus TaxID=1441469 RepID=A0A225BEX1_TALAT|nr:hypothetical protein UA08_00118 [Talaromyces atroroseus]OKL64597.1 hypothetical protein UA08_00118 [Talaromyces atroroseus]